jgi:hypothetical protein
MEFQHLDINFNLHKTYKKIEIKSILVSALLSMNESNDQSVHLFADKGKNAVERGKGTTAEGLTHTPKGDFVVDM